MPRVAAPLLPDLQAALVRRARAATRGRGAGVGLPDAEDLAQTVIARLLATYGADTLAAWDPEKLYAYGFRALHNLLVDEYKRRREQFFEAGEAPASAVSEDQPERALLSAELRARLTACLGELPEEQRRFLVLSFELDSAPKAQIESGWPPGSAANACHRRAKLTSAINSCMGGRGGS